MCETKKGRSLLTSLAALGGIMEKHGKRYRAAAKKN